jgi:hypothetical protein
MLRWLWIIVAMLLVSGSADAQVFKPKSKKAAASQKASADPDKKAAKKQPRAGATKKRPKKKTKAERASDEEETSEPESKGSGKDYVKITDDDDIE